jgi:hypothetical protein
MYTIKKIGIEWHVFNIDGKSIFHSMKKANCVDFVNDNSVKDEND